MSAATLEEIAEQLLREAAVRGASAADVVAVEGDSLSVGVRLGEVEKVKRARAKHLGLRVFQGQRSAITSTGDFSPDALRQLVADSVALASVTAPDPFAGLPSDSELRRDIPDLELYDESIASISPERAIEWCRIAETAARDADSRITNSEGAEMSSETNRVVYAATNGFLGSYRTSYVSLTVVPVATHDGAMERDYWYSSARHLEKLEDPAAVGRIAAERTVRRLGARKVRTCEVPVVFDPETASSLIGHLAGAVSGNALYRGMSFLLGKLGQPIAPSFVQVTDDGTIPRALASKPFDGEGVSTRCTAVLRDGILQSYLFDSYSARKLDATTTGNAARGVTDAPTVSPTNLFLHAGNVSPAEIIRSVGCGFYVTELLGFGVNPVTGDYSRGAAGLWIESGKLAYPVAEVTIAGNLLEMLHAIEAVGDDLHLRRGISAPTIKIGRMTVAGN